MTSTSGSGTKRLQKKHPCPIRDVFCAIPPALVDGSFRLRAGMGRRISVAVERPHDLLVPRVELFWLAELRLFPLGRRVDRGYRTCPSPYPA